MLQLSFVVPYGSVKTLRWTTRPIMKYSEESLNYYSVSSKKTTCHAYSSCICCVTHKWLFILNLVPLIVKNCSITCRLAVEPHNWGIHYKSQVTDISAEDNSLTPVYRINDEASNDGKFSSQQFSKNPMKKMHFKWNAVCKSEVRSFFVICY